MEPAPVYQVEKEGLEQLDKVLKLVKTSYYPTIYDKAAYIVSSIAGSQYFTNGNKRLAVITLLAFLLLNDVEVKQYTAQQYEMLIKTFFPLHKWESNQAIRDPHALFLYNLAIIIGDRKKWSASSFSTLWHNISEMFNDIYRFPLE